LTDHPRLAALVLAAGYSSRMGQFKPLLSIGRSIAIESAIDCFVAAGIEDVTVVTGYRAAALNSLLANRAVRSVFNARYDEGMFSSIAAGVRSLAPEVEACFVLPGDMPLVLASTIRVLAKAYEESRAAVVYPVYKGRRGHPPLICRRVLEESLTGSGEGGLRALLANYQSEASEVSVLDEGVALDMDTPSELVRVRGLAVRRRANLADCAAGKQPEG